MLTKHCKYIDSHIYFKRIFYSISLTAIMDIKKNILEFIFEPKRVFIRLSKLSFSKRTKMILKMDRKILAKEIMNFYDFYYDIYTFSISPDKFQGRQNKNIGLIVILLEKEGLREYKKSLQVLSCITSLCLSMKPSS